MPVIRHKTTGHELNVPETALAGYPDYEPARKTTTRKRTTRKATKATRPRATPSEANPTE